MTKTIAIGRVFAAAGLDLDSADVSAMADRIAIESDSVADARTMARAAARRWVELTTYGPTETVGRYDGAE